MDAIATWESDGGSCALVPVQRLAPFEAGQLAARNGAPLWINPHMHWTGNKNDSMAWFAGWCNGKQQMQGDT